MASYIVAKYHLTDVALMCQKKKKKLLCGNLVLNYWGRGEGVTQKHKKISPF